MSASSEGTFEQRTTWLVMWQMFSSRQRCPNPKLRDLRNNQGWTENSDFAGGHVWGPETVLHSFHVTDGRQAEESLLECKSRFNGTTVGGGGDLSGEVYELQP